MMISEIFWPRLRGASDSLPQAREIASQILAASRITHKKFPQETAGSIDISTTVLLWLLARYFRPAVIAEVGTFIGRSTLALSEGAGESLKALHTCDYSFSQFSVPEEFKLSFANTDKIVYYPNTSSTAMLKAMLAEHRGKVDCFFLDGRLAGEDLALIQDLRTPATIFILDDFEGVEKGTSNALILRQAFGDLILLRPEVKTSDQATSRASNTALIFPAKLISLSRQQEFPLDM
jgi:predicted O-methyltransferase YrrM